MTFKAGRNTSVWYNATAVTTYLDSADMSTDSDMLDTSTFGSAWKSAVAGQMGATYSFTGKYDPALTQLQASLGVDGGVLTVCPGGGAAIGDPARLAPIGTSNYAESSPVADIISFSWATQLQGALAFGDVLHPLGEDTNTTTGADKDDTAAAISATGWTAHIHAPLVDAGSWVITIQDAATNDWATIATFTAITVPASQRLLSAAANTAVRRHVRYVATRTGGSPGDGITFALAFARTRQS